MNVQVSLCGWIMVAVGKLSRTVIMKYRRTVYLLDNAKTSKTTHHARQYVDHYTASEANQTFADLKYQA